MTITPEYLRYLVSYDVALENVSSEDIQSCNSLTS